MKKIATISFQLISLGALKAQGRPETGAWIGLQVPVIFSKHVQWHNDAGYRTLGSTAVPYQYLYRTGIRYNFNGQWNTAGGVAFFFTRSTYSRTNDEFGNEFRFWEEVNYQRAINEKLQWQTRCRADQRFFAGTSIKTKYTAYRFRLRSGIVKKINNKWNIQLADEYMQQQQDRKFSFNQNRVIFTGTHLLNKSTQIQGSYMWVTWPTESQHIFILNFIKSISLHGN